MAGESVSDLKGCRDEVTGVMAFNKRLAALFDFSLPVAAPPRPAAGVQRMVNDEPKMAQQTCR